jgi:hypothetical protein
MLLNTTEEGESAGVGGQFDGAADMGWSWLPGGFVAMPSLMRLMSRSWYKFSVLQRLVSAFFVFPSNVTPDQRRRKSRLRPFLKGRTTVGIHPDSNLQLSGDLPDDMGQI